MATCYNKIDWVGTSRNFYYTTIHTLDILTFLASSEQHMPLMNIISYKVIVLDLLCKSISNLISCFCISSLQDSTAFTMTSATATYCSLGQGKFANLWDSVNTNRTCVIRDNHEKSLLTGKINEHSRNWALHTGHRIRIQCGSRDHFAPTRPPSVTELRAVLHDSALGVSA